jgi:hypothetical protein
MENTKDLLIHKSDAELIKCCLLEGEEEEDY